MITLREYTKTDLDRLVYLANNKNVSRYLVYTFPYPYTKQDAEWWIETGSKTEGSVTKVIEYQGEYVGSVGTTRQTGWKQHIAEIGYWIGEEYWDNGIATEALKVMTDLTFASTEIKKLIAPVLSPNKASIRVLQKCGYEFEGVLKIEVKKDHKYFDIHHYAKINL